MTGLHMTPVPNLFLIGTAKGGSTTLATHLTSHPDITLTTEKEPNIFNVADVTTAKARLAKVLPEALSQQYVMDGSVNYSQFPKFSNVPAHIAEICGTETPRFIYMIRNPVDRAISQYFWRRERYGEDRPPHEALVADDQYILSSRYDLQIEQYRAHFAPEQMRVLVHDVYFADVAGQFAELCRWLGIDDSHVPDVTTRRGATNKDVSRAARFPVLNRLVRSSPALRRIVKTLMPHDRQMQLTKALSKQVPREEIPQEVRENLARIFADSISRTEELTGHDLSVWRNGD